MEVQENMIVMFSSPRNYVSPEKDAHLEDSPGLYQDLEVCHCLGCC